MESENGIWFVSRANGIIRGNVSFIHDQRIPREIRTINNLFCFWRSTTLHRFAFCVSAPPGSIDCTQTCARAAITILSECYTLSVAPNRSHFPRTRTKETGRKHDFLWCFWLFLSNALLLSTMPSPLLHFAWKSFNGILVDIMCRTTQNHVISQVYALVPAFPQTQTKIHDNVINEHIFHSFGPHKVIKWQTNSGDRRLKRPLLAFLEIIIIKSRH